MLVSKAMACAIVLALGCGLAEAQMQPRNGEITLKNGKTRAFKYIGNGYSDKDFQYAEEPDDLKPSFSDMTNLDLSGVAEIDFVEMTKKESSLVAKVFALQSGGVQVRKANVLLRDGRKLDGVFLPFIFGGTWGDGTISGHLLDLKIVKITFTK